jgi:hypothetical protein
VSEGDERDVREDNSLGRLLALSDGVFAIAMATRSSCCCSSPRSRSRRRSSPSTATCRPASPSTAPTTSSRSSRSLLLRRDIVGLGTAADDAGAFSLIANGVVFALCIPAGYVLGDDGPFVLLLLIVAGRLSARRRQAA